MTLLGMMLKVILSVCCVGHGGGLFSKPIYGTSHYHHRVRKRGPYTERDRECLSHLFGTAIAVVLAAESLAGFVGLLVAVSVYAVIKDIAGNFYMIRHEIAETVARDIDSNVKNHLTHDFHSWRHKGLLVHILF